MSTAEMTAEMIGLELAQSPESAKDYKGKVATRLVPRLRRFRSAELAPARSLRARAQASRDPVREWHRLLVESARLPQRVRYAHPARALAPGGDRSQAGEPQAERHRDRW